MADPYMQQYMRVYHLPKRIRATEDKLARLYREAIEIGLRDIEHRFQEVTEDDVNEAWDRAMGGGQ